MAYTPKQSQSWQKYRAKNCDRLAIDIPKGAKDRYKAHAERIGKPLRRLIMDLIEDDIKRVDKERGEDLSKQQMKVADDVSESR